MYIDREDAISIRINRIMGMRARDKNRLTLNACAAGFITREQRYASLIRRLQARFLEPRLRRISGEVLRARGWTAYLASPGANERDMRAIWAKIDEAHQKLGEALALLQGERLIDEVVSEDGIATGTITAIAA
jgi:hypothetical protein